MTGRRKLIAGNWKMNGLAASVSELQAMVEGARSASEAVEVAVCPPFTLIDRFVAAARGSPVRIGGQDAHEKLSGAHTGCVSAVMLRDLGAGLVIVGHSERRQDQGETDALVQAKARAAMAAGLVAIVCIGETEAERDQGRTLEVLGRQLGGSVPPDSTAATLVVAYEPVWAIGTGRTPTTAEVAEAHGFLRATLGGIIGPEAGGVRLLYGGSVKPSNAVELLAVADVDGALVGGASLKAGDFLPIVRAAG